MCKFAIVSPTLAPINICKKCCYDFNMHRKKGFTLVETLVVAVIASLFLTILFKFYFQSNRTQTQLIDNLQMQASVVTGVNKILREIRTGTSFVYPGLNENSSVLIFTDFENNHKAIYAIKNKSLSEAAGKTICDLFSYTSNTEKAASVGPTYLSENLKPLCSDLEAINFRLNSANSVVVDLKFSKNEKSMQIVSEGVLMNSGEVK